jgi:hypothetical protein
MMRLSRGAVLNCLLASPDAVEAVNEIMEGFAVCGLVGGQGDKKLLGYDVADRPGVGGGTVEGSGWSVCGGA